MSKPTSCYYCGRGEATERPVCEPTERSTYHVVARVVCETCFDTYRNAPWGFPVEDYASAYWPEPSDSVWGEH